MPSTFGILIENFGISPPPPLNPTSYPAYSVLFSNVIVRGGQTQLAITPPIQVSQPGAMAGLSGLLQIAPGQPVTVNVNVTGTGFDASDARSTTVQLQAGGQTLTSAPIALSTLAAAGSAGVVVTFSVTFDPTQVGTTQTLTATVDPGNTLGEVDLSATTQSIQVAVVANYKLKVELPDTDPAHQFPLNPGIMATVPPSNYGGLSCSAANHTSVTRDVRITCVDQSTGNAVTGCAYQFTQALGPDNGGHGGNHSGTRPLLVAVPNDGERGPTPIPLAGADITMFVQDVAGDIAVSITGTDPYGNSLKADPLIFEVKVDGLEPIVSPWLSFVVGSHPDTHGGYNVGRYGTSRFSVDIESVVANYQKKIGVTAHVIRSEGASLYWGGLFDINDDWSSPHCGHRDGQAIDISWQPQWGMTDKERLAFTSLIDKSVTLKFYENESPRNAANHWHVMPR